MSNYTQEELQGMSRVELRKAAIATLKIDNKEASNTKSGDLIDRIIEMNGAGEKAPARKRTRKPKKGAGEGDTTEAAPSKSRRASTSAGDIGKLVDAVGKAVDETKEELVSKVDEALENQDHIMKQQFMLFGLLCDIFKMMDEPDTLEARVDELDKEWDAQGNG